MGSLATQGKCARVNSEAIYRGWEFAQTQSPARLVRMHHSSSVSLMVFFSGGGAVRLLLSEYVILIYTLLVKVIGLSSNCHLCLFGVLQ